LLQRRQCLAGCREQASPAASTNCPNCRSSAIALGRCCQVERKLSAGAGLQRQAPRERKGSVVPILCRSLGSVLAGNRECCKRRLALSLQDYHVIREQRAVPVTNRS